MSADAKSEYVIIVTSSAARQRGEACGVTLPRPAAAAESRECGRGNVAGPTDRRQFSSYLSVLQINTRQRKSA